GELPEGFDFVSPEVDPHRDVRLGGEHVDDPAPDGELPSALDPVGAVVPERRQSLGELREVDLSPSLEPDRLDPRRAHFLHHASNRGPDHETGTSFGETVPSLSPPR